MRVNIEWQGTKELQSALNDLRLRYREAFAASVFQEAQIIMAASQRQVPVKFGRLRNSRYVAPPVGQFNTVEFGYGVAYAPAVHDRDEVGHHVG